MKSGIVAYDITITKYRTKLSEFLCGYGERVQFSVFEFEIPDERFEKMVNGIEKIYKEYIKFAYMKGNLQDVTRSIRIYIICENCMRKIIVLDKNNPNKKGGMVI